MPVSNTSPIESTLVLADFTSSELIIPSLRGQDATAAIQELSAAIQHEGRVSDMSPFIQSVLDRELLHGTVTEPGWAIPHAVVNGLNESCFALGRWGSPKVWTKSKLRVNLVFLFAIPETDAQAYMRLIISLGRFSNATQLVERLLKGDNAEEMLNVLKQVKLPAPSVG
jgi:mannitol/fructose-specific phosphotransferase system IIA component (Ntr-type)